MRKTKFTMKRILLSAAVGIASIYTSTAQGLTYKWKPNAAYNFKAVQNDKIQMGGGGMMGMMAMAGDMEFVTESAFTLAISSVGPDGSATGSFYLTNFLCKDKAGNTMATLANLPKKAIQADFTVDKKGNFTFLEIPVLLCREGTTMLVESKIEKGEMAASAEADGEKVTLFAEFNPKTGSLKAGYTTATIAKPKPKAVVVKEDDETIDLVPTDFLDMLVLPEGPVAAGQVFKTKMYGTEIVEKVEAYSNNIADIRLNIKSGIDVRKFEKDAQKMAGDDEAESEGNTGMDMGDMGMPGMDGMGGSETPQISQDMTGDIRLSFDNGKGMFNKMTGNMVQKSNMMGMETTITSTVVMTAQK